MSSPLRKTLSDLSSDTIDEENSLPDDHDLKLLAKQTGNSNQENNTDIAKSTQEPLSPTNSCKSDSTSESKSTSASNIPIYIDIDTPDELPILNGKTCLPDFKLKDYGFQKGDNLHCCFKYLALIYDQMCECINEEADEPVVLNCQSTEYDNLGMINFDHQQLDSLLENVNFVFDSKRDVDYGRYANQLFKNLNGWCPKIKSIKLNRSDILLTNLKGYNYQQIEQIISNIKLHSNVHTSDKLLNLNFTALEFEVVFSDLKYYNLKEIGLNLTYCNYLIYQYFKSFYPTCGYYLSSHEVSEKNLPFYKDNKTIKSAFCHLYFVPLNLTRGRAPSPFNPLSAEPGGATLPL